MGVGESGRVQEAVGRESRKRNERRRRPSRETKGEEIVFSQSKNTVAWGKRLLFQARFFRAFFFFSLPRLFLPGGMARSSRIVRPPDRFANAANDDELRGITSSEDDDDDDTMRRGVVVVADDESSSGGDEEEDDRDSEKDEAATSDRPNSESECDGASCAWF